MIMFDNGITFNWVQDEEDKKQLQTLWDAAVRSQAEKDLNKFKKLYRKIREKQITSRSKAFDSSHQKLVQDISVFGDLINLDKP